MKTREWLAILRADTVAEMRSWLLDCVGDDDAADDVEALSDAAVVRAVANLYVGGIAQFIADGEPIGGVVA